MQNIDINEAKRRLPELIEQASSGDEVINTWVERFNVQARPGATTIIKEINPLLLKACALDPTS